MDRNQEETEKETKSKNENETETEAETKADCVSQCSEFSCFQAKFDFYCRATSTRM